jgi:hypothetical protein
MTHTPASGPLGPLTTPPMSSLSLETVVWATAGIGSASSAAKPIAAAVLK